MAERLATEYVKTCLHLTEAEMIKFTQLFDEHQVLLQISVFENGNQEFTFKEDGFGENIVLFFERRNNDYVADYAGRLSQTKLTHIMRKAVTSFKADAIVNRIYSNFTIVYHYSKGTVVKIIEMKANQEKVIYEYKNEIGELEHTFLKRNVESEIQEIHKKIDTLLDLRIRSSRKDVHIEIDQKLQQLNHRLFVLEA